MSTTADTERWVPDGHTFAARLALIRQRMGWNIKEAARACGLSDSSWREWELSDRRPRDYEYVCKQIANVAWCDLHWLMTGAPMVPPHPPGQPFRPPHPAEPARRLRPVTDVAGDRQLDLVTVSDDAIRYVGLTGDDISPGTGKPVGLIGHQRSAAVFSFLDTPRKRRLTSLRQNVGKYSRR